MPCIACTQVRGVITIIMAVITACTPLPTILTTTTTTSGRRNRPRVGAKVFPSSLDASLCTHRETLEVGVSSLVQGAVCLAFTRNPWNTVEFALGAAWRDTNATRRGSARTRPEKRGPFNKSEGCHLARNRRWANTPMRHGKVFFPTRVAQCRHSAPAANVRLVSFRSRMRERVDGDAATISDKLHCKLH